MTLLGVYGDFVQAQTVVSSTKQTGFIPTGMLDGVPASLPKLVAEQVPPIVEIDGLNAALWNPNFIRFQSGELVHNNTTNGWTTVQSDISQYRITGPFRVRVQFTGTGPDYGVLLYGRLDNQSNPSEWWKGTRRLDLDVDNGKIALLYRDGTSPDAQVYQLPQSLRGDSIELIFNVDGSNIQVANTNGTTVKSISLSTPLFPDKVLYFGVNAGPQSILKVSEFSLLTPPDGKDVASLNILGTKPFPEGGHGPQVVENAERKYVDLSPAKYFDLDQNNIPIRTYIWPYCIVTSADANSVGNIFLKVNYFDKENNIYYPNRVVLVPKNKDQVNVWISGKIGQVEMLTAGTVVSLDFLSDDFSKFLQSSSQNPSPPPLGLMIRWGAPIIEIQSNSVTH